MKKHKSVGFLNKLCIFQPQTTNKTQTTKYNKKTVILKWAKHSKGLKILASLRYNAIPWSEVNPETLGVWQIRRDSSLNLAASSVLIFSSTAHCTS